MAGSAAVAVKDGTQAILKKDSRDQRDWPATTVKVPYRREVGRDHQGYLLQGSVRWVESALRCLFSASQSGEKRDDIIAFVPSPVYVSLDASLRHHVDG